MKYTRLSKEQLEALHEEFINFLASQTITSKEWETLKKEKPEVAEDELDVFSDLIWEGALTKVEYLENAGADQLFLFEVGKSEFRLIHLKVKHPEIDLNSKSGRNWLLENLTNNSVEITRGSKKPGADRNQEVFDLINQGAQITNGTLFKALDKSIAK